MIINVLIRKINTFYTISKVGIINHINLIFDFFLWPKLLPEIDEIIYVDPFKIKKSINPIMSKGYMKNLNLFKKDRKFKLPTGTTISGDWDLKLLDIFEENNSGKRIKILIDLFSSLLKRDEQINKYKERLRVYLLNKNPHFSNKDALNEIERAIRIFHSFSKHGFKDYFNKKISFLFFFHLKEKSGIRISISRNGEIVWVGSHHRIAIARALNLKKVPALVYFRHPLWQSERMKFIESLNKKTNIVYSKIHPDLKKIYKVYKKS